MDNDDDVDGLTLWELYYALCLKAQDSGAPAEIVAAIVAKLDVLAAAAGSVFDRTN